MKKRAIRPSILFSILLSLILPLCFSVTAFGASVITGYCGGDLTAEKYLASVFSESTGMIGIGAVILGAAAICIIIRKKKKSM